MQILYRPDKPTDHWITVYYEGNAIKIYKSLIHISMKMMAYFSNPYNWLNSMENESL